MGGIAAVYLTALSSGDTVVITKESYGTTQDLALNLSKFGIKTVLAGPDTEDFLQKIKPGVALVLIETITNPLVRVVDIPAITKRCKEVGARLVVDNTFATPLLYRPLENGAWLSLHSVTKYIGGHNDIVGGAIAAERPLDLTELWEFRRRLGSIMGPFEAFLALRGVATLKVRFDLQCQNALLLAKFLHDHPKVEAGLLPRPQGQPIPQDRGQALPREGTLRRRPELQGEGRQAEGHRGPEEDSAHQAFARALGGPSPCSTIPSRAPPRRSRPQSGRSWA